MSLTSTRLREVLDYDPDTGNFTWRVGKSGAAGIGQIAGGPTDRGYWRIEVDGTRYRAHRLAWLYMTDEWPSDQIDHINGTRSDNAWANLRLADNHLNHANSKTPSNNSSGFKGVSWVQARNKWAAYIKVNCKRLHLGYYNAPEDASAAYADAARKHWGEFARVA